MTTGKWGGFSPDPRFFDFIDFYGVLATFALECLVSIVFYKVFAIFVQKVIRDPQFPSCSH